MAEKVTSLNGGHISRPPGRPFQHPALLRCSRCSEGNNVMTGHEIEEPTSPPPPSAPAPSHVPWWKIWQKPPEIVLAIATAVLAAATIILAAIAGIQAYILATTDVSTRKVADAAQSAAGTAKATLEASRQ